MPDLMMGPLRFTEAPMKAHLVVGFQCCCSPPRLHAAALGAPEQMNAMGINQGTSGNASCRVPGGFLVTASGVPYDKMTTEHIVFVSLEPGYYGSFLPSSEWRMHFDIYQRVPEAQAVVHAHPTYCTALSCQRRDIPAFHYMVAAAGGKEIKCSRYATFGTQELSDSMLEALGSRRSCLLGNHGMICHGASLRKALWLANETECLARQYMSALSTGVSPAILSDEEMDVILAKFKSYGKQPDAVALLSDFERRHAIDTPRRRDADGGAPGAVEHIELRQQVIETCLQMNRMGINQGTSGNVSCRVPGGFLVTASGIPYEDMRPEQVVYVSMDGCYSGEFAPSSEWRMHFDIYKRVPEAMAAVHAHPTYCTALSCQRQDIPAFHYMVAAAGGKAIECAKYETFGTQELSESMLSALGSQRSCLLANHGMICYGPSLEKALWLANETECLARQYVTVLSTGSRPEVLPDAEMDMMLAKFKTYGKQPKELEKLSAFERRHAVTAPRFCGAFCCDPCAEGGVPVAALRRGLETECSTLRSELAAELDSISSSVRGMQRELQAELDSISSSMRGMQRELQACLDGRAAADAADLQGRLERVGRELQLVSEAGREQGLLAEERAAAAAGAERQLGDSSFEFETSAGHEPQNTETNAISNGTRAGQTGSPNASSYTESIPGRDSGTQNADQASGAPVLGSRLAINCFRRLALSFSAGDCSDGAGSGPGHLVARSRLCFRP
ncbi:unnamed protein product [Prorocentrum cordatum]|uniref:Class II aldolase/adducin N-terminal domain-containing protein n=1 Tax=Prorocentrum cordatum TaxID=2364126 RepID=A0ABN9RB96_9DINO|nr:unnamed protein product [Polarella glacialis]